MILIVLLFICAYIYMYEHERIRACVFSLSKRALLWMRSRRTDPSYRTMFDRFIFILEHGEDADIYQAVSDVRALRRGTPVRRKISYRGPDLTCHLTGRPISRGTTVMALGCGHVLLYDAAKEWTDRHGICPLCGTRT